MCRTPSARSARSPIPDRPARDRLRRRPDLDTLERRIVLSTNPNANATVGVYDENAVNTNAVDFVASGSNLTNTQFAADMASAFSRDEGGVINGSVLGAYYSYGTSQSKVLTVNSPTNWAIGQGPAISGTGAFSTTSPNYSTFSLNFSSIDGGAAGERVREVGITAMSYGADYGNVTVTANLASGGSLRGTRHILEAAGQGDTFYGFAAPSGDAITGFTLHYDAAPTSSYGLWFDDIGFITGPTLVTVGDSYQASRDTTRPVPPPRACWPTTRAGGDADRDPGGRPGHGTLALNADGSFAYTPAPASSAPTGSPTRRSDGTLSSSPSTRRLNVAGERAAGGRGRHLHRARDTR